MRTMCLVGSFLLLVTLSTATDFDQVRTRSLIPGDAQLHSLGLKKLWHTNVPVQWPKEAVHNVVVDGDTILVHTQNGSVTALNAETGATRWNHLGNASLIMSSVKPALNEHFAFVYDGNRLLVLDRNSGSIKHSIELPQAPLQNMAAARGTLCISAPAGHVKVFRLPIPGMSTEGTYVTEKDFNVLKPTLAWTLRYDAALAKDPVILSNRIVLPRSSGELMILDRYNGREWDRLPVRGLDSQLNPAHDKLYFSTGEGLLHAVETASEITKTCWNTNLGSRLVHAPVPAGNDLYVATEKFGMMNFDKTTGREKWKFPGVARVLTASPKHVYAMDRFGKMIAMDRATGTALGQINMDTFRVPVTNLSHDRIYFANHDGVVLALRDASASADVATLHTPPVKEKNIEIVPAKKEADIKVTKESGKTDKVDQ